MGIQRMDNVAIVVDDLDAAIAFFTELGLDLEGRATVEGGWASQVVGLANHRCTIAMMRTPDGHSRLELSYYERPAAIPTEPAPANTLGLHRTMFAVDDVNDTVERLRAHGGELVGEIAEFEGGYRMCYLRGPAGIIVGLAQQLS